MKVGAGCGCVRMLGESWASLASECKSGDVVFGSCVSTLS